MRNVNTTTQRYAVTVTFPEWCDAEGEFTFDFDGKMDACEFATAQRRKYPPCSVKVNEITERRAYGQAFSMPAVLIADLSARHNWWR